MEFAFDESVGLIVNELVVISDVTFEDHREAGIE